MKNLSLYNTFGVIKVSRSACLPQVFHLDREAQALILINTIHLHSQEEENGSKWEEENSDWCR